jgi:hypothetical protein
MAVKFTNNAKTTLASGINSSVTTATVTDGSVFPTLGAGEYFYCTFDDGTNNEIVKVTARSGNTLTIVRGVDNTTARSFSASDAAELRATSALLTDIQENIAAKSANQTVYSATTASSATDYDIGIDPGVEANASVFLDGVYQHHDTFSFSGSTLTFDTAPVDGTALEVIVDNLVNLQSSNLTVDTFIAADVGGSPQVDFTLSDAPAAETNLIVFVDGVFQANDTYTISSTTLSMTDGVTADRVVTVYVMNPVNIGTPSDGTITSSKLSGDITMPGDLTVTGDVAFDSPTFVVDNANSRVGIGTASPSTLLDIVGDVKMSANLTVDTSTLVVDATNNRVGIGTSSPDAQGGNQSTILNIEGSDNITYLSGGSGGNAIDDGFAIEGVATGVSSGDKRTGSIMMFRENTSTSSLNSQMAFYTTGSGTHAERMRIDSSGNLLVGTTTAFAKTSIAASKTATSIGTDYNPSILNIQNTNATNGNLSLIGFQDASAFVNVASIGAINNTHSASPNSTSGSLGFYTKPTGVGYVAERMRIDSSGNLLVGTTDDVAHVTSASGEGIALSAGSYGGFIGATRASDVVLELNRTGTTGDIVKFRQGGVLVGSISVTGSATAYNTSSDARLKDVTGEARGLEVINELNPVAYNWKADGKADEGLIAQEVKEIVPNAVSGSEEEMYQMDYSKLVVHLVKGMKEQQEQIETLKQEIREIREGG